MCGIAAIYAYHETAHGVDRTELRTIRDYMAARGPDGKGEWYSDDNRVGIAHRRLSIIDLTSRAAQPMTDDSGQIVISFNGEIYNYQPLKSDLEKKGYVFRTNSDTEVLIHLYKEMGDEMFKFLRGMFAIALWDTRKQSLLLGRDPYGIKPLYYADDGRTCRIASQVKALRAGGNISNNQDPAGLVGFYLFGSVPEPYTIWQDVKSVPAGSYLWINSRGTKKSEEYFSISETFAECQKSKDAWSDQDLQQIVRTALLDSVRSHLVSDVPVGAFLSAGIDSGALVGLMRDAGQNDIQTVTLSFEEFKGKHEDEAPLAQKVAEHYGTSHVNRVVTHAEFLDDLPDILHAMDQPTIDGINTWFVSKAAKELGLKVAISGLGGDELFGGYPSFKDIPKWVNMLSIPSRIPYMGYVFQILTSWFSNHISKLNPKTKGMVKMGGSYAGAYLLKRGLFMPWELEYVIDVDMVKEGLRRLDPLNYIYGKLGNDNLNAFSKVATLESSLYMRNQLLRDTDWSSMAHSLEVRTPLVDASLLYKLAVPLSSSPTLAGKHLLANSPSHSLPAQVVNRPKSGFFTPINDWQQQDVSSQVWRRKPILNETSCPWARRWSYEVCSHLK